MLKITKNKMEVVGSLQLLFIFASTFAGVVKLVDTPDLGSGAARCVGSSPIARTIKKT